MGDNSMGSSSSPSDTDLNKYNASGKQREIRGQDVLLPIANVGNIMRKILPLNARISKEAKETMQECASEFIRFVTSEASHQCREDNRKIITGEDLILAMSSLGLEDYAEALKNYLHEYKGADADILYVRKHGFSNDSSEKKHTSVVSAREDPHQYHFHIGGEAVEGSTSHNQRQPTLQEEEAQAVLAKDKHEISFF
ncbi:hypothetical protein SUGI_0973110 [Cryptomeria japonica]|uniref:nuclear transcription factor Y subunit B-4-like n=1 Tax=Cryptomeria japonica TaxID=3369 RepID=UPI0024147318|nr:nuclear transcription factor Y subunit B-4-like [Cryptomeria japonica]GLJ46196.1 hypothetical protein SUGI_0973110 [Cryptomeria japonica]